MATDLVETKRTEVVRITGKDEVRVAEVIQDVAGVNRLATDASVVVNQIFGEDPFPDTFFELVNTGSAGNTFRIQIAATSNDPTSPDRNAPAVDVTYTVLAGEVGDELKVRDSIIGALNGNSNFSESMKAKAVADLAIVWIQSKFRGEFYERSSPGSFSVSVTGTALINSTYPDVMVMKGKATSLTPDPKYPHALGVLEISGNVQSRPQAIGSRFEKFFEYNGSSDMRIDGSTPVNFKIDADPDRDYAVSEIRWFGGGNGIKFNQFLSKQGVGGLANGCLLHLKSDNQPYAKRVIKTTEDFKNIFAGPGINFTMDVQPGSDQFLAVFKPDIAIPIKKQGAHGAGNDDYIHIDIQDNLLAGLSQLEAIAIGWYEED